MTLGTGVFFSTVLVVFTLLYLKTRGSWNWKRITISILVFIFGGSAIVGGGVYLYSKISGLPKVQNEYAGITLGSNSSDVRFLLGKPDEADKGSEKCDCDSTYWYENKEEFSKDLSALIIRFNNRKVVGVIRVWLGTPYIEDIQGINRYSTISEVENKFGKPSRVEESEDGTERRWYYNKYQVRFGFEKGSVTSLGIFFPSNDI